MSVGGFSHVVRVGRIPAAGKHVRIEADAGERRHLADALGIVEVISLTAELDVRPAGAKTVSVQGTLHASVVQTDVITLDPVRQEVAEAVDLRLTAEDARGRTAKEPAESEAEERDVYRNGEIDLGAILGEHLALGLDPYPRAPGSEFEPHVEDNSADRESPFAELARLKRDQE